MPDGVGEATAEDVVTTEPARATTEFTYYFRSLVAALGQRPGWYGVFAEREPGAARAFAVGADVPPWDVVRAVLHDLAAGHGTAPDEAELARARVLHRAAVTAWDAVPGAEAALRARLEATVRARDLAHVREREAARARDQTALDPLGPAVAARLANILAWARDDRERATARCEELRERIAALAPDWAPPKPASVPLPVPDRGARAASWGAGIPGEKRVRGGTGPRGARFAGAYEDPDETAVMPERPAVAVGPGVGAVAEPAPRGARFAGAPAGPLGTRPQPAPETPAADATPRGARFAGAPVAVAPPKPHLTDPRRTADARAEAVRLGDLRRTGQTGAAYIVLCEAAEGPADRLPYLVRELERAGLAADVATLLWETAAQPPTPLAAAAAALAAEGRPEECRTLLHQAAARPPADIAAVAAVLTSTHRTAEAGELLETVARARPTEDSTAIVRTHPTLAEPLVTAAERISKSRRRDIVAALRRANLPDH